MKIYYDMSKVAEWMPRKSALKLLQRLAGKDLWVICAVFDDGDGGPAGPIALRVQHADWWRIIANWCELYGNIDLENLTSETYYFKLPTIKIPANADVMTTEEFIEYLESEQVQEY